MPWFTVKVEYSQTVQADDADAAIDKVCDEVNSPVITESNCDAEEVSPPGWQQIEGGGSSPAHGFEDQE